MQPHRENEKCHFPFTGLLNLTSWSSPAKPTCLDLAFLQQGGLSVVLGEECCFYVDHSEVIKDSMAKVYEGLAKWKREWGTNQSRFESWFESSPWLTILISSLLGPLLILVLLLTFGPCILNRLVQFIKERLGTVQLMAAWPRYQMLTLDKGPWHEAPTNDNKRDLVVFICSVKKQRLWGMGQSDSLISSN